MQISKKRTIRFISLVAIMGAIAIMLYAVPVFQVPLPIFPPFMELHFDEAPIFVAGYAGGPLAAVATTILKTIAKLPLSRTFGVGELCDVLLTLSFVLPASLIFKRSKDTFGFVYGLVIGFLVQILMASVISTYAILPIYCFVFGFSNEQLLGIMQAVNPNITDVTSSYIAYVAIPFNAIKNLIVIAMTIIVYLPLKTVIKRVNLRIQQR